MLNFSGNGTDVLVAVLCSTCHYCLHYLKMGSKKLSSWRSIKTNDMPRGGSA